MVNVFSNIDFRFYFSLFLRRLPLFLMVVVVVGGAGAVLALLWPPSYQATAKVLVESPQIPTDMAKSTVPTSAAEQFQIIQEDVLSRESLLALADHFAIYADRPGMARIDMFDDMLRRISIVPIPVEAVGGGTVATVFHISFKSDQPKVAADLVNDLVSMILNKDVQLRTERATDTVTFFTKETQRLDAALRTLDTKVLAFKNEHINAMPDSIDFRRNQQTAQQQRLLVLAEEEAMLRKRQTDMQMRPLEVNATPVTPEEQILQALRQSLAQQQASFAEDSPTIKTLHSRIAAMQKALLQPADDAAASPLSARALEMADIKERIVAIGEERTRIDLAINNLGASIAATPGNETVLNSMQRDHQNLQAQYDAAIARLADASTGQQIELLLKGERLSLIEAAEPPQTRQGPGQRILLLASAAIAILLGLVGIIVPEFVNRRIRRPAELVSQLQITPYITVPYISRRFRPARMAMRLSVSILVPLVLLLATATYVEPVRDLMTQAQVNLSSSIAGL